MGFERGLVFVGRPCDLPGLCREHVSVVVVVPLVLPRVNRVGGEEVVVSRSVGRAIGLDVHRDFCEVAICEAGRVRSAGRMRDDAGGAGAVRAEPGARGSGGVGGDRQRRGRSRGSSSRTCAGWWWSARTTRGSAGAREDRPAGRAHAGAAVVGGRAGRGVDARRALPRDAPPAGAPRAAGALALAREERDPRRADAPPAGQAAVLGPVRASRAAGGWPARAAGRGARDRRRGAAPHRVPRSRDRRGRAADRAAGARLAETRAG